MKAIFKCYSCEKVTEYELTTSEFQCECGIVSATTLSPNNPDVVVLRDLSAYDFKVKFEKMLDEYFDAVDLDSFMLELQLTLSTIWFGYRSGKIKSPSTWGPPVCVILEHTIKLIDLNPRYIHSDDFELLSGSPFQAARTNIETIIGILNLCK